jgi:predicted nuclease of predicted toxin-antitoxin system
MFLIIDENVDDAVGHFLRERGHRVAFVRDILAGGIADTVIAVLGNEDSAIVVTHDKDFKGLVRRAPEGIRQRFRRLGRISPDYS